MLLLLYYQLTLIESEIIVTADLNLPSYLHIGYSKAASTWFQKFLQKHPDVFVVCKTRYFSAFRQKNYKTDLSYYSNFFNKCEGFAIKIESDEHLILPFFHPNFKCACTNIHAVKSLALRINRQLPKSKVIIIIRNQTDILLSRYSQYILQGGTEEPSKFLNELVFNDNNFMKYMDYRYSIVINLLYDIMDQSRVLVLFHEELRENQQSFLKSLFNFFNLSFNSLEPLHLKPKNVALSAWGCQVTRNLNRVFVKEIETIYSRTKSHIPYFAWRFFVKAIRLYDSHFVNNSKKSDLFSKIEIEKIIAIFAEDNLCLSKMFDKPLKDYGYTLSS